MRSSRKSPPTPLHRHLGGLEPYPPGKPLEEVQREFGLDSVVKLASNENPLGPSPKALQALRAAAGEMNLYPDGAGYYLKRELGRRLGVSPSQLILGNGSDEITLFLALCYLGRGRALVTSEYAFVRYRMAAQLVNAPVRTAAMKDFRHDDVALAKSARRGATLLCVDNPGNPTGSIMTRRELTALLGAVPPSCMVLVDEAYYEFARDNPDYPDTVGLLKKYPNLIITRTFSKAYGLAGLRIGYGIAREEIIRDLERVRPPFNTSRAAQAAALAALDDWAHLRRTAVNNAKGKAYLARQLSKLGLKFAPTWANFILVDVSDRCDSGPALYRALLAEGVIIRPLAAYGLNGHIRVSIGTPAENRKFIAALKGHLG